MSERVVVRRVRYLHADSPSYNLDQRVSGGFCAFVVYMHLFTNIVKYFILSVGVNPMDSPRRLLLLRLVTISDTKPVDVLHGDNGVRDTVCAQLSHAHTTATLYLHAVSHISAVEDKCLVRVADDPVASCVLSQLAVLQCQPRLNQRQFSRTAAAATVERKQHSASLYGCTEISANGAGRQSTRRDVAITTFSAVPAAATTTAAAAIERHTDTETAAVCVARVAVAVAACTATDARTRA